MDLIAIMPLSASMESILQQLEVDILTRHLGSLTSVSVSLAAACVAIAMVGLGPRYVLASQFNWWELCRPIVIFALVCGFPTFVLNPLRGISGVYATRFAETVGTKMEDFKKVYREKAIVMCHEQFGADGDVWNVEDESENRILRQAKKIGNKLLCRYFQINEKLNYGAGMAFSGIMFFFLNLYASVMIITANIYLVIMALIGPFTFALSILPAFPNGITMWIERYIQYTLWQPLVYLVLYIGTEILILGNQSTSWGGFWAWLFMLIAIFTVIKQVPAIASFIIEGAGLEALAGQISGLGTETVNKVNATKALIK